MANGQSKSINQERFMTKGIIGNRFTISRTIDHAKIGRPTVFKGKVHSRMIFDYLLVFNNSVSMVLFKFLKDNCMSVKLKLFENSWAPPLAAISGPRRLNKNIVNFHVILRKLSRRYDK